MNRLLIYFFDHLGVCIGDIKDTTPHSHHLIQISIGLKKGFHVFINENWIETKAMIINHDIEHKFIGIDPYQAIILIDPESVVGQALKAKILKNETFVLLDTNVQFIFASFLESSKLTPEHVLAMLNQFLYEVVGYTINDDKIDDRIIEVQQIIKVKDVNLDLRSLAKSVCLSESRLMHLFKEQVGISIKKFILWQKLLRAIKYMMEGLSLTNSAIKAGFSDSAHLSRTFRQMFGVSPSEVFKNSSSVQVFIADREYS